MLYSFKVSSQLGSIPFSLPDEASGRNVVEIVFVLPVFVLKCLPGGSQGDSNFGTYPCNCLRRHFSAASDAQTVGSDRLFRTRYILQHPQEIGFCRHDHPAELPQLQG